jgi:hypothetical protein
MEHIEFFHDLLEVHEHSMVQHVQANGVPELDVVVDSSKVEPSRRREQSLRLRKRKGRIEYPFNLSV